MIPWIRLAPYFIAGGLGVALMTLFWSWDERGERIDALTDDLRAANASIAAHEEAAAVLDAHYRREREAAARWEAVAEELSHTEGADEPLNDYERAVLERVRTGR
jgi:hypothetical protein